MAKKVVTHYNVDTGSRLIRPIRIAHISDIHERNCDWLIPMLKRQRPDIIFITGDTLERYDNRPQYDFENKPVKKAIITTMHTVNFLLTKLEPKRMKADIGNVRSLLTEVGRIAPVYMSLGNHEAAFSDTDRRFIGGFGITLLDNADIEVELKGFRFRLGGMSCWDYEEWLPTFLAKDGYKILLCHKPDFYVDELTGSGIDLTLSGHTHGGQMLIGKKGMGFFVPSQGVFGKYAHGSFFDNRLIVSSGCSNTAFCPRIFNPRELVIVNLR